jgi:hypothetical protein
MVPNIIVVSSVIMYINFQVCSMDMQEVLGVHPNVSSVTI